MKRLKASVLVFTLVLISVSLVLALALFKADTMLIRGRILKYQKLKEDISIESLENVMLARMIAGEDFRKGFEEVATNLNGRNYKISAVMVSGDLCELRVEGRIKKSVKKINVFNAAEFASVYARGYSAQFDTVSLLQTPILSPSVQLSISQKINLLKPEDSDPSWLNAGIIELTSRAEAQYVFSEVIGDRTENKKEVSDLREESLPWVKIYPDVKRLLYCAIKTRSAKPGDKFTNVVNAALNEKHLLAPASYADKIRADVLKHHTKDSMIYFVPAKMRNDSNWVDPWRFADHIAAPASYEIAGDEVKFLPPSVLYDLKVTSEMLADKNQIKLSTGSFSWISEGRGISKVQYQGNALEFNYDTSKRILTFKKPQWVEYLSRADGRKKEFQKPSRMPTAVFVNSKKADFSFKDGMIIFPTAPAYAAVIEFIDTLPVLQAAKEAVKPGTLVYIDSLIRCRLVELDTSRLLDAGAVISDEPLFITGKLRRSISVETSADVYVGDIINDGGFLTAKGRLVYLYAPADAEMSLASRGSEVITLAKAAVRYQAGLFFGQEILPYRADSTQPGVYSLLPKQGEKSTTFRVPEHPQRSLGYIIGY